MFRLLCSIVALTACLGGPAFAQSKTGTSPEPRSTAVVNLNTASASDFEALPGIGPKTAARIIEYRQKNGPIR